MRASAVGRVRTLESRLLAHDFINRIIDSSSLDEALQILGESADYQPTIGALSSSADWESALETHLREIIFLIGILADNSEAITALRLKWDIQTRRYFEIFFSQTGFVPPFFRNGNWRIDVIQAGIEDKKWEPPCDKYIAPALSKPAGAPSSR